jgi:LL-diaminopimelate aminotransferase
MIVSLPANPVGSIAREGIYDEIVAWAKKYDVLIIHDNAYSDIIFDGVKGGSFLATEGAMDVGVEFFSLSKSFNLTGARISFLIGRKDVVDAFRKLRSQIDFGMFLPIQAAAVAALQVDREKVRAQCRKYQERRDTLAEAFHEIGWEIPKNRGSMFMWARIPKKGVSSMDFCMDLLDRASVLCTPGSSFGHHGEGYVRFALVLPPEELREMIAAVDKSGFLRR